jgi:hypothetical protein
VDASSCPASSTAMARAAILSAAPEGEAIAGRWLTGYGLLVSLCAVGCDWRDCLSGRMYL